MKNIFARAGFTMIELLVVIAVIGVLAVAVLSSINPIEQINKGRDTRTRSDAAQLINAADRFFATQEHYPWNDTNYGCGSGNPCPITVGDQDPTVVFPSASFAAAGVCTAEGVAPGLGTCKVDGTGGLWLDALGDNGTSEVKGGFIQRVRAQTTYAIYTYKPAGTASALEACFRPSSLAFQAEALKNCRDANVAGGWDATLQGAACPGGAGVGTGAYAQSANKDELICLP